MASRSLLLQDRNQKVYTVNAEISNLCGTIKMLMLDAASSDGEDTPGAQAESNPVILPAIDPQHFELILEWCNHELENKDAPGKDKQEWSRRFFEDKDDATVLAIMTVA